MGSQQEWATALEATDITSSQVCILIDEEITENQDGTLNEIILGFSSGPGKEWVKVRHVPSGDTWHPATDQLLGTDSYGTPYDDTNAWTIPFSDLEYDQFLFITGDAKKWMVMDRS